MLVGWEDKYPENRQHCLLWWEIPEGALPWVKRKEKADADSPQLGACLALSEAMMFSNAT